MPKLTKRKQQPKQHVSKPLLTSLGKVTPQPKSLR
jgi:hypothetical protein